MIAAQFEKPAGSDAMAVQPWLAPAMGVAGTNRVRRMPDELQGAERRVWQEAEMAGRKAGLAAARVEIDAKIQDLDITARRLEHALQLLSRPLANVDDVIHGQIVTLATLLARTLVRRELRAEPEQVIAIVRETVALLPGSARGVRVLLHPEDAALVRDRLVTSGPEQAWAVVDDPVLSRGDCRVLTEYAQIDARIEARLNAALAQLLGDERSVQRTEEES